MSSKVMTRIQSRLSRRGVKVTMGGIRLVYQGLVVDLDNPSEDEIDGVVDHFIGRSSPLVPTQQADVDVEDRADSIASLTPIQQMNADVDDTTPTETAIALQEKADLVSNAAVAMGLTLNTRDLSNIAQNIDCSSDDLHSSLDEIKSAIIAYIEHKSLMNAVKIGQVIDDITQIAAGKFDQNSQQLAEGLQEVNRRMESQSEDFKSKIKSCLSAFIPQIEG